VNQADRFLFVGVFFFEREKRDYRTKIRAIIYYKMGCLFLDFLIVFVFVLFVFEFGLVQTDT